MPQKSSHIISQFNSGKSKTLFAIFWFASFNLVTAASERPVVFDVVAISSLTVFVVVLPSR